MYERLKGFRDFYPDEMGARRAVIDSMEATAQRYGFREVGTPALERTQLYIDKSGEDIVDELYHFTDHGDRDVALTPELTPTIARMVVDRGQALTKPIKWYSTRPFWRYEEPQQARFREFYQVNVDIIGSADPAADGEVLAYAADALVDLGLTNDDFTFHVSHRDILGGLLASFGEGVDTRAAIRAVDKSEKIDREDYHDLLVEAGLSYDQAEIFDDLLDVAEDDLDDLVDFAGTDRVRDAVANLQAVLGVAEELDVRDFCSLSLETARGLDYYTGVVFECFDDTGEVRRAVFGGGRYDELIESLGGQPTPAVGVAPGIAPLTLLLQRAGVWPEEAPVTDYYVLQVGDTRPVAADLTRTLRSRGHVAETDVSDRSFGSQLDYADSINAETVVIVGERDLENDAVTVKDMRSGEQVQVPLAEFPGDRDRPTYDDFA